MPYIHRPQATWLVQRRNIFGIKHERPLKLLGLSSACSTKNSPDRGVKEDSPDVQDVAGTGVQMAGVKGRVVVNDLGGSRDGTGSGSAMADAVVSEITDAGEIGRASCRERV